MLIYAVTLTLRPENGVEDIVREISEWVGRKYSTYVDPEKVGKGLRQLKLPGGAALTSMMTLDADRNIVFPYKFNARLTHGQEGVPGRLWTTEIGVAQSDPEASAQCTVVLKVNDISTKFQTRILPTRPSIVRALIDKCRPVGQTPGISLRHLCNRDAEAFRIEIERANRTYPIVIVSATRDHKYLVDADRLRELLVGIAQVVVIPEGEDTFALQSTLGKRFSAFGGAINVLWPYREINGDAVYQNTLLTPAVLEEAASSGNALSAVFETITHRMNLPNEWKHTTAENVRYSLMSARLRAAQNDRTGAADLVAYEELLNEVSNDLSSKDHELDDLRATLENASNDLLATQSELEFFKDALSKANNGSSRSTGSEISFDHAVRDLMLKSIREGVNLEEAVTLIENLFPDRVTILDSAKASAKDADRAGFAYTDRAFEMMAKLATDYWSELYEGKGDQDARVAFGAKAYSAKESSRLTNEGRAARTFRYRGDDIFMEKHLKIGVKDAHTETWRLHFHWDAESQKIVIAHCGKHLPL